MLGFVSDVCRGFMSMCVFVSICACSCEFFVLCADVCASIGVDVCYFVCFVDVCAHVECALSAVCLFVVCVCVCVDC